MPEINEGFNVRKAIRDSTRDISLSTLEKKGYKVLEAENGQDVMDKIKNTKPDAVILDVMMPKLDGYSVNIKLKEDPETADIPVIIITGKGGVKEFLELREDFKIAAYFEKPFPVSAVTSKLEELFK